MFNVYDFVVPDFAGADRDMMDVLDMLTGPLGESHTYMGILAEDDAARAWVLSIIARDPKMVSYLSYLIRSRPDQEARVEVEAWDIDANGHSGLGVHTDGDNGGQQITVCVYPLVPGRDPWTGGELMVAKEGAQIDSRNPDFADTRSWLAVDTAPTAKSWRVVCFTDDHFHTPLKSTGGDTRRCVIFHAGFPYI